MRGQEGAIKAVLDAGGDPNMKDASGTPIFFYGTMEAWGTLQYLMSYPGKRKLRKKIINYNKLLIF
jgi:hypothetical protein